MQLFNNDMLLESVVLHSLQALLLVPVVLAVQEAHLLPVIRFNDIKFSNKEIKVNKSC